MFYYQHKNSTNFFLSPEKLAKNFLPNLDEYEIFEYSDEIKNPMLKNGKIIEAPKIESESEKFTRIFTYFANSENPLETEKLEGIEFNDKQIGDLILARVFGGNPHGQTALQTKVIAMLMAKKENPELLVEILQKMEKINEVRVFFELEPIAF